MSPDIRLGRPHHRNAEHHPRGRPYRLGAPRVHRPVQEQYRVQRERDRGTNQGPGVSRILHTVEHEDSAAGTHPFEARSRLSAHEQDSLRAGGGREPLELAVVHVHDSVLFERHGQEGSRIQLGEPGGRDRELDVCARRDRFRGRAHPLDQDGALALTGSAAARSGDEALTTLAQAQGAHHLPSS